MYLRCIVILTLLLPIAGCGLIYKQNVQQGNVLEEEQVEQLRTGMTRQQVTSLLGSPSVKSPFHSDRWDYASSFAPRGANMSTRHLVIHFEDDRVSRIEGDYLAEADMTDEALEALEAQQEEEAIDDALRQPPTPDEEEGPEPSPIPPPDQ